MNIDEVKKQRVAAWIEEGLKLSEIQSKLASELSVTLTYMEVRLLVNELKLMPKDPPPPPAAAISPLPGPEADMPQPGDPKGTVSEETLGADPAAPGAGSISVSVDRVARPGALVSGNVTFTDGNSAAWYLDQHGRLGIVPKVAGYKPAPQDLQTFQVELQKELAKLGF